MTVTEIIFYIWLAVTIFVHTLIAFGVSSNASQREKDGKPVLYFGSPGWFATTLLTGVFGLTAYWLIHHSALRKVYNKDGTPSER